MRSVASVTTPSSPSEPQTIPSRSSPPAPHEFAADPQALAGDQHQLDAHQIMGCEAIFQAMNAAGIFRHIAADGAGDLARWIGRVIETLCLHGPRHRGIGDARLHHNAAIVIIDFQDPVHAREAEQNAIGQRQRAA